MEQILLWRSRATDQTQTSFLQINAVNMTTIPNEELNYCVREKRNNSPQAMLLQFVAAAGLTKRHRMRNYTNYTVILIGTKDVHLWTHRQLITDNFASSSILLINEIQNVFDLCCITRNNITSSFTRFIFIIRP